MKGLNENLTITDEPISDESDVLFTFFDILNIVCLCGCFCIVAFYWIGRVSPEVDIIVAQLIQSLGK